MKTNGWKHYFFKPNYKYLFLISDKSDLQMEVVWEEAEYAFPWEHNHDYTHFGYLHTTHEYGIYEDSTFDIVESKNTITDRLDPTIWYDRIYEVNVNLPASTKNVKKESPKLNKCYTDEKYIKKRASVIINGETTIVSVIEYTFRWDNRITSSYWARDWGLILKRVKTETEEKVMLKLKWCALNNDIYYFSDIRVIS